MKIEEALQNHLQNLYRLYKNMGQSETALIYLKPEIEVINNILHGKPVELHQSGNLGDFEYEELVENLKNTGYID